MATIRSVLRDEDFDAAWAAGWALSLEEAIAEVEAFAEAVNDQAVLGSSRSPDVNGLSPREREVLRLVAAGKTDREIATALFVSKRTVGTHLTNILAKLDLANRTEAAAWAVRHGLA